MLLVNVPQQSKVISEFLAECVRAMTDYIQAAAPLRPRQREASHNQESPRFQCRHYSIYIGSTVFHLGEKVEHSSIMPKVVMGGWK